MSRAFQVLDTEPDVAERTDVVELDDFDGEIVFDDVSLVYEGGRPGLAGVNLVARRGEQVALVGETGSGKTSVLNLIPRLHDATSGRITIDGVDVRDATLTSLRRQVSIVPQEPLLFSAVDPRTSATAGSAPPTWKSKPRSGLPTCTTSWRRFRGYDSQVGERGVKLSVGQQQRIAIARAFLKGAPILLLDEPTSALDANTEAELLESLEALMAGKTVFIVAHRLSTIRGADRIYVLDGGRVVESGSHEEARRAGWRGTGDCSTGRPVASGGRSRRWTDARAPTHPGRLPDSPAGRAALWLLPYLPTVGADISEAEFSEWVGLQAPDGTVLQLDGFRADARPNARVPR